MTSKEAAIQRLKELKGKPLKEQVKHIFTYYWFPIIAVLGIAIFAVSYIIHVVTLKDVALNVTCVNAAVKDEVVEEYIQKFAQSAGIDLKEYEIEMPTNMMIQEGESTSKYNSAEALIAMVAAQSVDVLVSEQASMLERFYQDILADLSEVLTDEQMDAYQDSFLYLDGKILEEVNEMTNMDNIPSFPDPTKPEEMEDPVPVAIRIPADTEFAKSFYPDYKDGVVLGLAVTAPNIEHALAFLDFVMK